MNQTDLQFSAQLLDEYARLKRIRQNALKENAETTVALIDDELELIKMKLQLLELPQN